MAQEQLDIIVKLVDEASSAIKNIQNDIKGLGEKIDDTSQRSSNFSNTLRNGLVALGTGALLNAVKNVTGEIINQAAAFEQSKIAFGTMLGSAEAGTAFLQKLADFAAATPFTLPGVENSARLLLAMGIEADNTIPTLKALGDVAAGLSVPIEQLAANYGQVRTANQLAGDTLRDFNRAGVPLMKELATQFNVTEAEIKKMAETGKINFASVEQAFKNMTGEGGVFFNLMDKQSKSFNGIMSNMKDKVTILARELGGPLIEKLEPALEGVVNALSKLVDDLRAKGFEEFFRENQQTITVLAGILGGLLLGAIVGLTVALWGLLGPIIIIGAAFAAVGGLLTFFFTQIYNGIKTIQDNLPMLQEMWNAAWDAIVAKATEIKDTIVNKFNEIKDGINNKINEIKDNANTAWNNFKDGVVAVWNGITDFFTIVWNVIVGIFKFWAAFVVGLVISIFDAMGIDIVAIFTSIKDGIISIWQGVSDWLSASLTSLSEWWTETWNGISEFVGGIWDFITGKVQEKMDETSQKVSDGLGVVNGIWQSVWGGISNFTKGIWDKIKGFFNEAMTFLSNALRPWLDSISKSWTNMWEGFSSAAKLAWEGAKSVVKEGINWIIGKVNGLIDSINGVVSKGGSVLGLKDVFSIPKVPLLADGGNVIRGGSAIVGEAGPELVSLPHGARVTPLTGNQAVGTSLTVVINNPTILKDEDVVEFGDRLVQVLKQHMAIT